MFDYPKSEVFTKKLNAITPSFKPSLRGVEDAYINHKLNPGNNEYYNILQSKKNNISSIYGKLFELDNEVSTEVKEVGKELEKYTKLIEDQRKLETQLKDSMEPLNEIMSGAAGARKVTSDTYKLQYVGNIYALLGILVGGYMVFRVFSTKGGASSSVSPPSVQVANPT
tara:strand:- start:17686 stop:18192 length:507 start_codon:yes stop_codon:yes gene_type:complete